LFIIVSPKPVTVSGLNQTEAVKYSTFKSSEELSIVKLSSIPSKSIAQGL
jgi:hypothetical protein